MAIRSAAVREEIGRPTPAGRGRVPGVLRARRIRHRLALGLLGAVITAIVAGPLLYSVNPLHQQLDVRLAPLWSTRLDGFYPLGGDALGRDILARTLSGARASLLIGVLSVLFGALFGVTLGVCAGYFGSWGDTAIMRLVDVQMSMPFLVFALVLSSLLGPGIRNTIVALTLTSWVIYARVARAETLTLRRRDFVEAAWSLGAGHAHIMIRHILPNLVNILIVVAALEVGQMMLLEAALSFLGLGVPPPLASLGGMVKEGQTYVFNAWWVSTIPGAALMLIVLFIVSGGEALRARLDPLNRT